MPYASTTWTPSASARARNAGGHGAPPTMTRRYSCIGAPASSSRSNASGRPTPSSLPRRAAPRATRSMSKPSCTVHGTPVTYARAKHAEAGDVVQRQAREPAVAGSRLEPVRVAAAHHLHARACAARRPSVCPSCPRSRARRPCPPARRARPARARRPSASWRWVGRSCASNRRSSAAGRRRVQREDGLTCVPGREHRGRERRSGARRGDDRAFVDRGHDRYPNRGSKRSHDRAATDGATAMEQRR